MRFNSEGNSLLPNFKCLADDVVAVVFDKATVAVEHRQLILVEPDGNLLLGSFDALRYGRKPLFVSPCPAASKIDGLWHVEHVQISLPSRAGATPVARIRAKRVCGGSTAHKPGSLPPFS